MSSMSYLDKLLGGGEFQWRKLGEVGTFIRGSGIQKSDFTESGVGCIHYGQIHTHYGLWATETKSFVDRAFSARLRKAHTGDLIIATTSEDDEAVAKAVAWLGVEEVAVSTDGCEGRPRAAMLPRLRVGNQRRRRSVATKKREPQVKVKCVNCGASSTTWPVHSRTRMPTKSRPT